ncbi:MAG: putative sulfate/molybdate transporter [Geminicoccaceae bacterium]
MSKEIQSNTDERHNKYWWIGDLSGAFADLGTFLPLVIGLLLLGDHDPSGLLIGFGVFAVVTGLVYRRPVPIQPMKVLAALAIAGGLSAAALTASGILLGFTLLFLGISGLIEKLDRLVPRTVLFGLQLGLGVHLIIASVKLTGEGLWIGVIALAILLALQATMLRSISCLMLLVGAVIWSLANSSTAFPPVDAGLHLPSVILPDLPAFVEALEVAYLPQLALTVTNAVLMTAVLAGEYFPTSKQKITPRKLALSTGGLNLLLAPFGAIPMCHGAGGLATHYHQGARSGLAPIIFGGCCLMLGMLLAPKALAWLMLVPLPVVAAILAYAGFQLAHPKRFVFISRACLAIVLSTALISVLVNVAAGLVFGLFAEFLRSRIAPLQRPTS